MRDKTRQDRTTRHETRKEGRDLGDEDNESPDQPTHTRFGHYGEENQD
jgi:hypothetical protein